MSTTVTYKGNTITTVDNETKVLATGGKYLEGNITLTDVASGGGSGPKEVKDVNFVDYDGTIVESYTTAEWANVTELPANPSHTDIGLTAQGWNWTKQAIDTQLTDVGGWVWVGQSYITTSGDTEIDIEFLGDDGFNLSPYLQLAVDGTAYIDWGDNSTLTDVTGSSLTTVIATQHVYGGHGSYTISISAQTGSSFALIGTSSQYGILSANVTTAQNHLYTDCVKAVRIGERCSIGSYAFYNLVRLEQITIPEGVTSLGASAFNSLRKLKAIVIPRGCTSMGANCFANCYSAVTLSLPYDISSMTTVDSMSSLKYITIPYGVTGIGKFDYCSVLESIAIPSGIIATSASFKNCIVLTDVKLGTFPSVTNAFQYCSALREITIPYGATVISTNSFGYCYSLGKIVFPETVTIIGTNAFSACSSLKELRFESTTPPTFSNSWSSGIPAGCVIYVPDTALNDYKTANNVNSTIASQMVGYEA